MQNCKRYVQLLSRLILLTMEYQMKVEYTTMRGNIQCKCIPISSCCIEDWGLTINRKQPTFPTGSASSIQPSYLLNKCKLLLRLCKSVAFRYKFFLMSILEDCHLKEGIKVLKKQFYKHYGKKVQLHLKRMSLL